MSNAWLKWGAGIAMATASMSALTGCTATDYAVAEDLQGAVWCDSIALPIHNVDTITRRSLRVFFRVENDFREDTLTTFVRLTTPDSLRYEEPFAVTFPRDDAPASIRREAVVTYRRNVVLNQQGIYRFDIVPARRVEGIEAIGLNIVKSE